MSASVPPAMRNASPPGGKCRVVLLPGTKEQQLVASRPLQAGELVLCESSLVHVPLPGPFREYAYGASAWALVDELLRAPALLREYLQWDLLAGKLAADPRDEAAEIALAAQHGKPRAVVRRLFLSVVTNNVGLLNAQRELIGHGLYRWLSRADHSCAPNTQLMPGTTAAEQGCLMARRDIAAGEPLTWCYFRESDFLQAPFEVRNVALRQMHQFVCRCTRCASERPAPLKRKVDLERHIDGLIALEARRQAAGRGLAKNFSAGG